MLALFIPLCASDAITHLFFRDAQSLDDTLDGEDRPIKELLSDPRPSIEDEVSKKMVLQKAKKFVTRLSDLKRKVFSLRFEEGRTQSDVADILGVSQAKVSREERALIAEIRAHVLKESD